MFANIVKQGMVNNLSETLNIRNWKKERESQCRYGIFDVTVYTILKKEYILAPYES
jgi:hypothetical protein